MKTLIIYYSFTSNNELLARDIQEKLDCDMARIEEEKKRTGFTIFMDIFFKRKPRIKQLHVFLNDYDNFIFIAPIWAGKIASPLRSFLVLEKDNISRYSFITICGGVPGQKEKITGELTKLVRKSPQNVTELWINDLLPKEKKDTVKYTTAYRIKQADLDAFNHEVYEFLKESEALEYHQ
ncbi:hypothetical protein C900_02138 [Fulvivirga imtechensis AK7]|uniref:Flavodoxin n=1 Tax=Fulvivirga imtechensis AK7 TaxID=1237149 RepID=L8JWA8_9BACT|nr:flavodoxin family protein [Fulvivirga imtechensis]ELR71899.1 hypothetical protein C900_02138 [Fulvivirga imtechensis AK7]